MARRADEPATEPFGLCWGQQWSWYEQQLPPSRRTSSLLSSRLIDLPDGVHRDHVSDALRLLLLRHSSLRTCFFRDASEEPRQRVWPVDREMYELDDFDDAEHCWAWLRQPLDITAGWPLRAAVVRSGTGPTHLGITVHHIAADLYGYRLVHEELQYIVGALSRREEPSLPPAGRQSADIAAFECSPAGAAVKERAIAYWLEQDEAIGEVLGSLRGRAGAVVDVMHVAHAVAASGRRRLAALADGPNRSEPTVAVALVARVLARHFGRATVPMTITVDNRHLPGIRRSVCSVAQNGLIGASAAEPRDLASSITDAWSGTLAAMQHAYYDAGELCERMRSLDSAGTRASAVPPNINVIRVTASDVGTELPSGGAGEKQWVSSIWRVEQRCASLYFHVRLSESHLTIELRAGGHLVSADDTLALVDDAMNLLHQ